MKNENNQRIFNTFFKFDPDRIEEKDDGSIILRELTVERNLRPFKRRLDKGNHVLAAIPHEPIDYCVGRKCDNCMQWAFCYVGELTMGSLKWGTINPFHFTKRCTRRSLLHGHQVIKEAEDTVLTLTLHVSREQPLKSIHRELFFPETRKHDTTREDYSNPDDL